MDILDASGHPVTNELTETISGNRVRCIKKDGSDRLWIATYSGGLGLILSDGNSVIKNGSIKYTLTDEDGLENTQILTLAENDKGDCLAGTDGAGIYILPAADLAANKENMSYKFFGIQAGLTYPITSNSFCFNDGRKLVFCTNTGVMSLDCEYQTVHDVKFGISDIYIDDEKLEPSGDGSYRIPADCSEIKIIPSVRNYSQEEVYVRVNLRHNGKPFSQLFRYIPAHIQFTRKRCLYRAHGDNR